MSIDLKALREAAEHAKRTKCAGVGVDTLDVIELLDRLEAAEKERDELRLAGQSADIALEAAAQICDERAMQNERDVDADDTEGATALRAAAWQMSDCAIRIRMLKGAS